eukprot:8248607-Karenia_brevis.AAC.1
MAKCIRAGPSLQSELVRFCGLRESGQKLPGQGPCDHLTEGHACEDAQHPAIWLAECCEAAAGDHPSKPKGETR